VLRDTTQIPSIIIEPARRATIFSFQSAIHSTFFEAAMKLRIALIASAFTIASAIASPPNTTTTTLAAAARAQIGVTTKYDPAYRKLDYPNGDVPLDTGVCSDVVVRALRTAAKLDLQKLVHEDMAANFAAYPKKWNLTKPDPNIDHRRVWNLMCYFKRQNYDQPITKKSEDYLAGDIVSWDLNGKGLTHIGIVSDKKSASGAPLILHNIGRGAEESDILFSYEILGHYRLPVK
jgi:uncharacterized protein YijF (DUF1287 family)